jgi:hypothetical protein
VLGGVEAEPLIGRGGPALSTTRDVQRHVPRHPRHVRDVPMRVVASGGPCVGTA